MPPPAKLVAALIVGLLVTAAAGCGESQQEAEKARERAAEQQRLREKAAGLEEEIKQLRAQQPPVSTDKATPRKGPSRNCGAGVGAGPGTSCAFALNTAQEWVDTSAGQTIQVFNPAAKRSYTMRCVGGPQGTTCRGARNALVYIP